MKQLRLTFIVSCSLCLISCGQANSEDSSSIAPEIAEPVAAVDAVTGSASANKELLVPVTESSQDKMAGRIPENFHGEYRSSLNACGSDADDSILVVSGEGLSFWETLSTPQSVIQKSPNELLVSLLNEGEGETWNTEVSIMLSENGDVLTVHENDFSFDRIRCPDD